MRYRGILLAAVVLVGSALAGPASHPATAPAKQSDRTVFLIDASGSIGDQLPEVVKDVYAAIDTMGPRQSFGVIVVSDAIVTPFPFGPATPDRKTSAWAFLAKLKASGIENLPTALAMAAKSNPDVVWLVTDFDWKASPDDVANAIKTAAGKRFRVSALAKWAKGRPQDEVLRACESTGGSVLDGDGNRIQAAPQSPATPPGPPQGGRNLFKD